LSLPRPWRHWPVSPRRDVSLSTSLSFGGISSDDLLRSCHVAPDVRSCCAIAVYAHLDRCSQIIHRVLHRRLRSLSARWRFARAGRRNACACARPMCRMPRRSPAAAGVAWHRVWFVPENFVLGTFSMFRGDLVFADVSGVGSVATTHGTQKVWPLYDDVRRVA
jgi:hypothetical protein